MINDTTIDTGRLKQACAALREHFDTVQIFCTRECDGNHTAHCHKGVGNWFARWGQVKSFVNDTEKEYILGRPDEQVNDKQEWE